jgi:hypothetical protein
MQKPRMESVLRERAKAGVYLAILKITIRKSVNGQVVVITGCKYFPVREIGGPSLVKPPSGNIRKKL